MSAVEIRLATLGGAEIRAEIEVELISFSFYLSGAKEKKTSPAMFVKASRSCLCPFARRWSGRRAPVGFF